ncbi:head scaffolding protein [Mycobacterium phage Bromden]|uniref:Scaffolding protein n=1 Tax=Mycobacterium phage Bromden TaxID=2283252 RepID=A0A345MBE2_9CAUD|nr:head scaffolding protein [Mycobacterium phage Bromden]AXH67813.1 scaffolding protein [Mycobacterium phage Bromden]
MSDLDTDNDDDTTNNDGGDGGNGVVTPENTFKAITSQEDFDKAVARRVARERKKYEGFDDLKAKAEQFDKLEAERGTELDKAVRRAEKAEQELTGLKDKLTKAERNELVRDIADEMGLPKKLAKRVQGDSEEDIRADIEDLLEGLPKSEKKDSAKDDDEKDGKKPPSQSPKQRMTFTATGDESDSGLEVSADDILKDINGGDSQ